MTQNFDNFGLPEKLLHALNRMQFTTPTPIQMQAIPFAMQGRDILGSAQTGTGKTGAFGIPLIARLIESPQAAALIMAPTRELAAQVMANLQQMIPLPTLKTALLIGGESMPKQFKQLEQRPRLIIGTPGRINDHLERGTLRLQNAGFLVLDEMDRMLDMGFGIQIERIIKFMPAKRQTMMFSATMPDNIIKAAQKYLTKPERIQAGSTTTPMANITQEIINTTDGDKYGHLIKQLETRTGSVIIFMKTKHATERMATRLTRENHQADAIHGDLQQRRRDRVIQSFRDKKFRILVATDVAARGLDIPHIEHVINYDLPQVPEDYIHRIGRTARAGAEGAAVNLITNADTIKWRAIYKLMNGGKNPPGDTGSKSEGSSAKKSKRYGSSNGSKSEGGFSKKTGGKTAWWDRKNAPKTGGAARSERSSDRSSDDRPSFSDRPKRDFNDRPKRTFSDAPREGARTDRPSFSDRPKRSFSDAPRESTRSDRPSFNDRPKRAFSDAPRDGARGDRPFRDRPAATSRPAGSASKPGASFPKKPGAKKTGRPFAAGKPARSFAR